MTLSEKFSLGTPIYNGSVQNLYYSGKYTDCLISETTSGGSVFDVGTIFNIEGSDTARTLFRHYIFTKLENSATWQELRQSISAQTIFQSAHATTLLDKLCETGARTHHQGMLDRSTGALSKTGVPAKPSNLTLIKKFVINKPIACSGAGADFYDYASFNGLDNFVIPLEYIVRFGVTSGSSILNNYNALNGKAKENYLAELGQTKPLTAWSTFETPVNDFTTKYEPSDRSVSKQEAALISSVSGDQFITSILLTKMASFVVKHIFNALGLVLWDLKWELAKQGDSLVFVDTIDTDSVRATLKLDWDDDPVFVHFNKQAMRDYYKLIHPNWYAALNETKSLSAAQHVPFMRLLEAGQADGTYPKTPEVDPNFLAIQQSKFNYISRFVSENGQSSDYQQEVLGIANREIEYYAAAGKKADYIALNGAQ